jgi:hypothetical protein
MEGAHLPLLRPFFLADGRLWSVPVGNLWHHSCQRLRSFKSVGSPLDSGHQRLQTEERGKELIYLPSLPRRLSVICCRHRFLQVCCRHSFPDRSCVLSMGRDGRCLQLQQLSTASLVSTHRPAPASLYLIQRCEIPAYCESRNLRQSTSSDTKATRPIHASREYIRRQGF